jgi:nitrate reductase NapD
MIDMLHIASLIVLHRDESMAAVDAMIAQCPELERMARGNGRTVVLCEGSDETILMRHIEALQALDGVLGVTLVHHHAEPRDILLQEMDP